MSYKKKKLKKSRLGRLKFRFGQIKSALLGRAAVLLQFMREKSPGARAERKSNEMLNTEKFLRIFDRYDRLANNPDRPFLEKTIITQLKECGLLRLCVFICPKFDPGALFSSRPENYMPTEANTLGLFEDRVAKVLFLKQELMRAGLPTEVNLVLGDNDAEEYIFPFIDSLDIDYCEYRKRQATYRVAFDEKCRKLFGNNCVTWSLAELGVVADKTKPTIPSNNLNKELRFFGWLFSINGPYRGKLIFPLEVLTEMAVRKYGLYGAQGKFLEALGGILLQTEGPGVWLERTEMLRCTGSPAIPVIYPWIRKEELIEAAR
jgi:hypothetical protein